MLSEKGMVEFAGTSNMGDFVVVGDSIIDKSAEMVDRFSGVGIVEEAYLNEQTMFCFNYLPVNLARAREKEIFAGGIVTSGVRKALKQMEHGRMDSEHNQRLRDMSNAELDMIEVEYPLVSSTDGDPLGIAELRSQLVQLHPVELSTIKARYPDVPNPPLPERPPQAGIVGKFKQFLGL